MTLLTVRRTGFTYSKYKNLFWKRRTRVPEIELTTEAAEQFRASDMDDNENGRRRLYETHIPTTAFQKLMLAVGSAAVAITDPTRDDMIAVNGETTGYYALKKMRDSMLKDPEGSLLLKDRPRINSTSVDLDYLRRLPEGTLAHAYVQFLDGHGFSPDARYPVQFVDDGVLWYIMQRYREAHDLIHTVLGMPTNMLGEVAVKWVEAIQTGLPMCYSGAVFGPLRFKKKQRQLYISKYLPWALRCGYRSKNLMNVYYEKHWDEPIKDLRKRLNIQLLNLDST